MSLFLLSSKSFRLFTVATVAALILLWVSNAFLGLLLDPILLRKPHTQTEDAASGFDKVEAIANGHGKEIENTRIAPGADFDGALGDLGAATDKIFQGLAKTGLGAPLNVAATGVEERPVTKAYGKSENGESDGGKSRPSLIKTRKQEDWFRLSRVGSDVPALFVNTASTAGVARPTPTVNSQTIRGGDKEIVDPHDHLNLGDDDSMISTHLVKAFPKTTGNSSPTTALETLATTFTAIPSPTSTPLILYAFSPSDWALPNLRFFLTHGLHAHATFIFILNGALPSTDLDPRDSATFTEDPGIVKATVLITAYISKYSNIQIIERPNECYDMGAFGEILLANSSALYKSHTQFITLNASLRGPFLPFWSNDCWSSSYLRPLNTLDKKGRPVKLIGMTMNCVSLRPRHVQSMILATDQDGMGVLLGLSQKPTASSTEVSPQRTKASSSSTEVIPEAAVGDLDEAAAVMVNSEPAHSIPTSSSGSSAAFKRRHKPRSSRITLSNIGFDTCPTTYDEAVSIEISLTTLIMSCNYSVSTVFALSHSTPDYVDTCTNDDVNVRHGWYEGGNLSPWETMFLKTRWAVEGEWVAKLSRWLDWSVGVPSQVQGGLYDGLWRGRSWDTC